MKKHFCFIYVFRLLWHKIKDKIIHMSELMLTEAVVWSQYLIVRLRKTTMSISGSAELSKILFWDLHTVTCRPIVGLRNRALLGSQPVNNSRPNTRYATIGEAVFSPHRALLHNRPWWRHTAPPSFPRQRRCKHGDLTQQSWLAPFFVSLVLAI
jgi:hypothetical protein